MEKDALIEWQNAIVQLPDRAFFDLIRLYLGKITTPFNKQRLVEKLSGFLCKSDIQDIIVQGLDYADICILTAIDILPYATKPALIQFLGEDSSVYARLLNLENRLLLYRTNIKESTTEKVYKITPLLYDSCKPLLNERLFFLPEKQIENTQSFTFADDIIFIGLYTFLRMMPDVLKKNGSFKQKALTILAKILPDFMADPQRITLFCNALLNLGLVTRSETLLIPQVERWATFFHQTPFERKMYIAAAACGHARRNLLHMRAQILADFLAYLPPHAAYTEITLKRIYYRIVQQIDITSSFAHPVFEEETEQLAPETLLEAAKLFGFLHQSGELWYCITAIFSEKLQQQALILSPSFELTLLPNTEIAHIFPVLSCLEPLSIQTTGRFEITQAACARAFEQNHTDQTLIASLQKATNNMVAQNIIAHITDWYSRHTAVGLYQGLILTVSEKKRAVFKQHASLGSLIYKELADGIFLLHHTTRETVQALLKKAGIDCACYNTHQSGASSSHPLAAITASPPHDNSPQTSVEAPQELLSVYKERYALRIADLKANLERMTFSPEDKRILHEKIDQKLIICTDQLTAPSDEQTTYEISALDFLGKIHTATTAIHENNCLEIHFDNGGTPHMLVGVPIHIEKNEYDAVLILQPKGSTTYEHISLARISKMIMIKGYL
ncbi:MAG: hypothetical protein ACTTJ7_00400 [Treponema sp.]